MSVSQIQAEDKLQSLQRSHNMCSSLRGWLGFGKTGQRPKVTDFCEKVQRKIPLTMTVNSILQETPHFFNKTPGEDQPSQPLKTLQVCWDLAPIQKASKKSIFEHSCQLEGKF